MPKETTLLPTELSRSSLAKTALPIWSNAGLAMVCALRSLKQPIGYPGFGPLAFASIVYTAVGYNMLYDRQYGASTCTGWSVLYPILFAPQAFKSFKPGPIGMVLWTASVAGIYAPDAYYRHFG